MSIRYYVRVSTLEQKVDRQLFAYDKADKIYIDKMTGVSINRPELQAMLSDLQENDIVVVKSIDRLSRSMKDFIEIWDIIKERKAELKILDSDIDTTTVLGDFFVKFMSLISELERNTIKQRQREGIAIAKAKGVYKGRKKGAIALAGEDLIKFKRFYSLGMKKTDLAELFNVQRATIYSWIRELKRRKEL